MFEFYIDNIIILIDYILITQEFTLTCQRLFSVHESRHGAHAFSPHLLDDLGMAP